MDVCKISTLTFTQLFNKIYNSSFRWVLVLVSPLCSTVLTLFQILFIFNFDYTTFGLVSLSLGSNVCIPFICNSTEIGLLNCKSDHGIPLAKCQWLSIAFHLKTQAPYCGIKVFSDLIPFCPSSI